MVHVQCVVYVYQLNEANENMPAQVPFPSLSAHVNFSCIEGSFVAMLNCVQGQKTPHKERLIAKTIELQSSD